MLLGSIQDQQLLARKTVILTTPEVSELMGTPQYNAYIYIKENISKEDAATSQIQSSDEIVGIFLRVYHCTQAFYLYMGSSSYLPTQTHACTCLHMHIISVRKKKVNKIYTIPTTKQNKIMNPSNLCNMLVLWQPATFFDSATFFETRRRPSLALVGFFQ